MSSLIILFGSLTQQALIEEVVYSLLDLGEYDGVIKSLLCLLLHLAKSSMAQCCYEYFGCICNILVLSDSGEDFLFVTHYHVFYLIEFFCSNYLALNTLIHVVAFHS